MPLLKYRAHPMNSTKLDLTDMSKMMESATGTWNSIKASMATNTVLVDLAFKKQQVNEALNMFTGQLNTVSVGLETALEEEKEAAYQAIVSEVSGYLDGLSDTHKSNGDYDSILADAQNHHTAFVENSKNQAELLEAARDVTIKYQETLKSWNDKNKELDENSHSQQLQDLMEEAEEAMANFISRDEFEEQIRNLNLTNNLGQKMLKTTFAEIHLDPLMEKTSEFLLQSVFEEESDALLELLTSQSAKYDEMQVNITAIKESTEQEFSEAMEEIRRDTERLSQLDTNLTTCQEETDLATLREELSRLEDIELVPTEDVVTATSAAKAQQQAFLDLETRLATMKEDIETDIETAMATMNNVTQDTQTKLEEQKQTFEDEIESTFADIKATVDEQVGMLEEDLSDKIPREYVTSLETDITSMASCLTNATDQSELENLSEIISDMMDVQKELETEINELTSVQQFAAEIEEEFESVKLEVEEMNLATKEQYSDLLETVQPFLDHYDELLINVETMAVILPEVLRVNEVIEEQRESFDSYLPQIETLYDSLTDYYTKAEFSNMMTLSEEYIENLQNQTDKAEKRYNTYITKTKEFNSQADIFIEKLEKFTAAITEFLNNRLSTEDAEQIVEKYQQDLVAWLTPEAQEIINSQLHLLDEKLSTCVTKDKVEKFNTNIEHFNNHHAKSMPWPKVVEQIDQKLEWFDLENEKIKQLNIQKTIDHWEANFVTKVKFEGALDKLRAKLATKITKAEAESASTDAEQSAADNAELTLVPKAKWDSLKGLAKAASDKFGSSSKIATKATAKQLQNVIASYNKKVVTMKGAKVDFAKIKTDLNLLATAKEYDAFIADLTPLWNMWKPLNDLAVKYANGADLGTKIDQMIKEATETEQKADTLADELLDVEISLMSQDNRHSFFLDYKEFSLAMLQKNITLFENALVEFEQLTSGNSKIQIKVSFGNCRQDMRFIIKIIRT